MNMAHETEGQMASGGSNFFSMGKFPEKSDYQMKRTLLAQVSSTDRSLGNRSILATPTSISL
jgi:hypothetical protein